MATGRVYAVLLLVLPALTHVNGVPLDQRPLHETLRQEFRDAMETGHTGPTLRRVAQELDLGSLMLGGELDGGVRDGPRNLFFCTTCNLGVNEVLHSLQNGTDPMEIAAMITRLCIDLGIGSEKLCENFIALAEPQVFYVLDHSEGLTGRDVCGMMFSGFGCTTNNPNRVWEVTMPAVPKPPVTPPPTPAPGSPVMKVLHLADTHYDPHYLEGSNAECGERYHCCRAESGPLETPEAAAGKWGDYRFCDAPKRLLEAVYKHISEEHPDLDFIIWTGDLVPHNIWNTSQETNLQTVRDSVQMIKDFFPDVPVFPAIGNHESHPVNAFPQPYVEGEFDISWLYDEITQLWETWLPADVAASVAYSAFYSTLIKPGLRILSVNSNYCYSYNWWLLYDDVDPASELQWMANELQAAEDAGEKVYLISHHPPGHEDCAHTWSHQYNKIILRYESTIAGLFYGHTHKDHFMMVYDPEEPTRAVHVGYVTQSQTPYHELNPGYRVFTVDGDYEGSSYRVLDHVNYITDLDEANANEERDPRFYVLYTAKEEYGLPDLTPASWSALVDQMKEPGSDKFNTFFKNYIKDARPYMMKGCDADCKSNLLCRLVVSDTSDYSRCDGLR
ncbi:sphingomyelin phosphodiesterase-like [Scylla paramamosain]|uniref:sphingomyelin phosphodiesterase-like n=1 Tax=Scylla paramamosain TaxID=85552 RepID=UPI003083B8CF